jgi:hypothetical protein
MNWTEVSKERSGQVAAIGRDSATKTTGFRFRNGNPIDYLYHNVSEEQHGRLLASLSLGSHHFQHFKSKFELTRVDRTPS